MSSAIPNLATCPRDATAIADEGVFVQRRIGEQLFDAGFKIWNTDREKTAFVTGTPMERATALADALKKYDAANGGPPGAAAPPPASTTPVREPETAAAPPKTRAKREPQTVADKAVVDTKTNGVSSTPMASDAVLSALLAGQAAINERLDKFDARLDNLEEDLGKLGQAHALTATVVRDARGIIEDLAGLVKVNFGLLNLFGQQVLNAPSEAYLPEALKEADAGFKILEGKG